MDDPLVYTAPVVFIDTLGMLLPKRLSNEVFTRLRQHCAKLTWKRCIKGAVHFKLRVHRPSVECLDVLEWLRREHKGVLNELHIAIDFGTATPGQAFELCRWLRKRWIKPNHRSLGAEVRGTWYSETKRWRTHNFIGYADRPSKIHAMPCAHLETRALGRRILRRLELLDPGEVQEYDLIRHWRKYLRLEEIDYRALGRQFRRRGRAKLPDVRKYSGILSCDVDVRAGQIIARWASYARGKKVITAQAVRDHLRQFDWFRAESALLQIDNAPLLQNARVVWRSNDYGGFPPFSSPTPPINRREVKRNRL